MRTNYTSADLAPRFLEKEEIENPYKVIYSVFDYASLPHIRESFRELLRVAVTGDYTKGLNHRERVNLMHFTEHVERLIEAAHIIHDQKHGSMLRMKVQEKSIDDSVSINHDLFDKPNLKYVTERILAITRAEKIYLLNDNGINDEDDDQPFYDIMILMPERNHQTYQEVEANIKRRIEDDADVSLLLVNARRAYQLIAEGHLFYSFACRKNKLLFDDGNVPLPSFDLIPVDLLIEKARESFELSMKKAKLFLQSAELSHKEDEFGLACFQLHQSIEICFRSILISLGGLELQTHHLSTLLEHSVRYLPELAESFPGDDTKAQKPLQLLQEAYIKGRYALDFTPGAEVISSMIEDVKSLHAACTAQFENRMEEFKTLKL
jgi:HEPN domain-containing protein